MGRKQEVSRCKDTGSQRKSKDPKTYRVGELHYRETDKESPYWPQTKSFKNSRKRNLKHTYLLMHKDDGAERNCFSHHTSDVYNDACMDVKMSDRLQSQHKLAFPSAANSHSLLTVGPDGGYNSEVGRARQPEEWQDRAAPATQEAAGSRKKKKRRRPPITICTQGCRYDVVRRVTTGLGIKEVSEDEAWHIYWTDLSISLERAKEMKRFQRVNHFPGMLEICRKDLLARNLTRMQKSFPQDYDFFPKTWCLPADLSDVLSYSKQHRSQTFIVKPECGSQGRGIFLTRSPRGLPPGERLVCQLYLNPPYLLDGYKFDLRVYALLTSCDPLRVYVYNEGLVRFATSRYADPSVSNAGNAFMHLTNYSLNKHSRGFVYDEESGSKRKISTLNRILGSRGVNTTQMWEKVDQAIVKTIISAWPVLKHNYRACFPAHDLVNHSPSFHTESTLDRCVKEALLADTLTLLNVWQSDRKKVLEEDRRRLLQRLTHKPSRPGPEAPPAEDKPWEQQALWEEQHLGNFRRVYPGSHSYDKFFEQPSSSLYLSTTSSRARGDCVRVQLSEIPQAKSKLEKLKRLPSLCNKAKENGELESASNPVSKENKAQPAVPGKSTKLKPLRAESPTAQTGKRKEPVFNTLFEALPVDKEDERERKASLSRRDFLVRSSGVLELIYLMMEQMGSLRQRDKTKYAILAQAHTQPASAPQTNSSIQCAEAHLHTKVMGLPAGQRACLWEEAQLKDVKHGKVE